jgi:uncharacterized membrane protein YkoI
MHLHIRVIVFSAIALAGTAGLLVTGLSGGGNEHGGHDKGDDEVHEHEADRSMVEQGDILSLEQILQNARQHHAGRVLETELEDKRGELVYEVEILDDSGEVWEMNFDARSGALLEEEQED